VSTASGTYVDLGGPAVTITLPPGVTSALVSVTSRLEVSNGNDGCYMGFAISGDTVRPATDSNALIMANNNIVQAASASYVVTGLPAGGTVTFTAEYRSPPGNPSCNFDNRSIWALPVT
jgi:hypothetical protein